MSHSTWRGLPAYVTAPVDQGQTIDFAWRALGEPGAVCRATDLSLPVGHPERVTYSLHRWRVGRAAFTPWHECPIDGGAVRARGRAVSAAEVARLEAEMAVQP